VRFRKAGLQAVGGGITEKIPDFPDPLNLTSALFYRSMTVFFRGVGGVVPLVAVIVVVGIGLLLEVLLLLLLLLFLLLLMLLMLLMLLSLLLSCLILYFVSRGYYYFNRDSNISQA